MPDLATTAEQFRAALNNKEAEMTVRLVNAYGDVYRRLQTQLDALTAELDVLEAKGELSAWKVQKLARMERLKSQIIDEITRYGAVVENEMSQAAREAIAAAQEDAKKLTQAALPGIPLIDAKIMAYWQSLNAEAVETMLGFLAEGSPLREMLRNELGNAVADQVEKKLIEGISLGYNPRKVAGIMQKELGLGLDWSLRTVRTANNYAYRESTRASYIKNEKIVKGWIWRSARNARTCMACLAMDGTVHKNDERLNDHHNGRCGMIPETVTYKDLGLNVEEAPHKRDTGLDWFKAQEPALQKKMMGPGKFKKWTAGEFKFDALIGTSTDPVYGDMVVEAPLKALVKAA